MPRPPAAGRRNPRRRAGRRRGAGKQVFESMSGTCDVLINTIGSGSEQAGFDLVPDNISDSRIASLSDQFRFFRFVELRCLFGQPWVSNAVSPGHVVIVAYSPSADEVSGQPTLGAELVEMDVVAEHVSGCTTPTTLVLTRAQMGGALKWYETEGVTTELLLDSQGRINVAVLNPNTGLSVVGTVRLHILWKCEFYGRLPATVSFERRLRRMGLSAVEDLLYKVFPPQSRSTGERIPPEVAPRQLGIETTGMRSASGSQQGEDTAETPHGFVRVSRRLTALQGDRR